MAASACSNRGFTLLEIMVAFVVTGLVVGMLLQLFGSGMRSVALSDEYSFAVQVAESRMESVGSAIKVEEGSENGVEEGTPYHWIVNMSPLELPELEENTPLPLFPYQVTVVVSWESNGQHREFSLSSLRFGEPG